MKFIVFIFSRYAHRLALNVVFELYSFSGSVFPVQTKEMNADIYQLLHCGIEAQLAKARHCTRCLPKSDLLSQVRQCSCPHNFVQESAANRRVITICLKSLKVQVLNKIYNNLARNAGGIYFLEIREILEAFLEILKNEELKMPEHIIHFLTRRVHLF